MIPYYIVVAETPEGYYTGLGLKLFDKTSKDQDNVVIYNEIVLKTACKNLEKCEILFDQLIHGGIESNEKLKINAWHIFKALPLNSFMKIGKFMDVNSGREYFYSYPTALTLNIYGAIKSQKM